MINPNQQTTTAVPEDDYTEWLKEIREEESKRTTEDVVREAGLQLVSVFSIRGIAG